MSAANAAWLTRHRREYAADLPYGLPIPDFTTVIMVSVEGFGELSTTRKLLTFQIGPTYRLTHLTR
ncbi:hypothetical protein Drose_25905 [Dactylosporangium roseum]|uniref:Uncharacterized protein n=1 Tax=Dactylosporangium roseum TaxID=47989 RepID=A0ABY5YY28_9ACTN|nr:hypothetical protein [Dactylosporangium roseum]UWZ34643.1 hypothetical protein Drose_25905 [Dactylosporangium roseum]